MKVNPSAVLVDFDNVSLKEQYAGSDGKALTRDLTLTLVVTAALLHVFKEDDGLSADKKIERFELAKLFHKNKAATELELKPEQASMCKEYVGKMYGSIVIGQVYPLLDGI